MNELLIFGLACFGAALTGTVGGLVLAWQVGRGRLGAWLQAQWRGNAPAPDRHSEPGEIARLRQALEARTEAELALQQMPQLLQQLIDDKLELLATQQMVQEQVRSEYQSRWLAGQAALAAQSEEHHAADLQAILRAIAAAPLCGPERQRTEHAPPPRPRPPDAPPPSAPSSASARPPELLLTPIVPAEPVPEPEAAPARELTDEEIDALPPELPPAGPPRKRILPRPPKPTLRSL
ncbi:hypothetical protein M2165_004108 [Variovorax sp. TBS-050B]|uniref:hypothetical protein n=1 Tax=Variovorax sp. TBS-050B TaxID=2940551 RepID=UPI002475BCF4|nr:hypothetical protein [Variovorax sp. TBS-050B]MDH6594219.1 hypothetical protein [Variovorax sp. TBS-050B]